MKALAHYLFQFTDDAEGVKLSMGLENFSIFMNVLASLGPAAYHLNYLCGNPSINVTDQIFLALMQCRMSSPLVNFRNCHNYDIASN